MKGVTPAAAARLARSDSGLLAMPPDTACSPPSPPPWPLNSSRVSPYSSSLSGSSRARWIAARVDSAALYCLSACFFASSATLRSCSHRLGSAWTSRRSAATSVSRRSSLDLAVMSGSGPCNVAGCLKSRSHRYRRCEHELHARQTSGLPVFQARQVHDGHPVRGPLHYRRVILERMNQC